MSVPTSILSRRVTAPDFAARRNRHQPAEIAVRVAAHYGRDPGAQQLTAWLLSAIPSSLGFDASRAQRNEPSSTDTTHTNCNALNMA